MRMVGHVSFEKISERSTAAWEHTPLTFQWGRHRCSISGRKDPGSLWVLWSVSLQSQEHPDAERITCYEVRAATSSTTASRCTSTEQEDKDQINTEQQINFQWFGMKTTVCLEQTCVNSSGLPVTWRVNPFYLLVTYWCLVRDRMRPVLARQVPPSHQ